jgi:serine protease Do
MNITLLETTSTQLAQELAIVAQQLQNSTVQVRSGSAGGGSGVIWHSDGLIMTNAHVAQTQRVTVELADGRIFQAVRTNIDPRLDLASLQIEATDLPAAKLGDSDQLRVGELVLAVGNPLGAVGVLTSGTIQSLALTNSASHAFNNQAWVRADIRLAPGNSGGLLANARRQVIGINTMIAGGLALAVPSNVVESFLKGTSRPYLGVTMQPVQILARRFGLLLLNVEKGSLAEAAGLVADDVIIGAFGQSFQIADDFLNLLWHSEPGEVLPLEFLRGLKRHYCEVKLPGGQSFSGVKSR